MTIFKTIILGSVFGMLLSPHKRQDSLYVISK